MGTYTTNKNLFMPSVGEQGWGTLVNGNFETIDTFLKPITVSGSTYTFTGNHVGNQSGGSISATSVTNSGTLTQTGTSTFTGKITANGGIGTTALTVTTLGISGLELYGGGNNSTNYMYQFNVGSASIAKNASFTAPSKSYGLIATTSTWIRSSSCSVAGGKATLKSISSYIISIPVTITHPKYASTYSDYVFYYKLELVKSDGTVVSSATASRAATSATYSFTKTFTCNSDTTYYIKLYNYMNSYYDFIKSNSYAIGNGTMTSYW